MIVTWCGTRALELLADLKRPEGDFAKLAQENSEDKGSAAKGGDVGFFGRGMMVKPFEDAAFAAQPGEIVGPVQSPFGLHIIKVEAKKTENNAEQVQARHILLKFNASEETMRLAAQNARFFSEAAQEKPFDEVVKLENLKVDTTNFFPAGGFIPGLPECKSFQVHFSKGYWNRKSSVSFPGWLFCF